MLFLYNLNLTNLIIADPKNLTISNETNIGEIMAVEGKPYEILCTVRSGRPLENISLYVDNRMLKTGGPGSLSYSFVPKPQDHKKTYTCKVYTKPETVILERSVRLFVYSKLF